MYCVFWYSASISRSLTVQCLFHISTWLQMVFVHRLLLITITRMFGDGCSQEAVVQRMNQQLVKWAGAWSALEIHPQGLARVPITATLQGRRDQLIRDVTASLSSLKFVIHRNVLVSNVSHIHSADIYTSLLTFIKLLHTHLCILHAWQVE